MQCVPKAPLVKKREESDRRRVMGFTIIETVVASSLLAISFIPILRGLTNVHRNTTIIEHKTISLALAQSKLDEIKVRSIYSYSTDYNESSTTLGEEGDAYLCNVTDDQNASLRTIAISVGYDENGDAVLSGGEVSITLKTYLAKRW